MTGGYNPQKWIIFTLLINVYPPRMMIPIFAENNCLNLTWVIYLQHKAKEIIQLGTHEISLYNFKTTTPYPRIQTCLNKLFCYTDKKEKLIFFFIFNLLILKGHKQHPDNIIDSIKFPELKNKHWIGTFWPLLQAFTIVLC